MPSSTTPSSRRTSKAAPPRRGMSSLARARTRHRAVKRRRSKCGEMRTPSGSTTATTSRTTAASLASDGTRTRRRGQCRQIGPRSSCGRAISTPSRWMQWWSCSCPSTAKLPRKRQATPRRSKRRWSWRCLMALCAWLAARGTSATRSAPLGSGGTPRRLAGPVPRLQSGRGLPRRGGRYRRMTSGRTSRRQWWRRWRRTRTCLQPPRARPRQRCPRPSSWKAIRWWCGTATTSRTSSAALASVSTPIPRPGAPLSKML
mmetsp:Transcript_5296/g.12754  ORF Transcript_5296/g.12754 Transcript_5296/m.12754 type:complete len:259 (+) Transcript_5296:349-1125(+)